MALWTSQAARSGADACLRLFAVLLAASGPAGQRESAWHLVMALFMLPCVVLAPINGAIGNSLPKRGVLAASAGYCFGVALLFGLFGAGWPVALGMVVLAALGSAVFVPTRFAMLPAAAADAGVPLQRVVSWIEAGAVLAMVGGMLLAGELAQAPAAGGVPATMLAIWALAFLCLLAALPTHFPSDVRRPEAPAAALRGFFRDAARIAADRAALAALLGVAAFRGIVAIAVGALIAAVLARQGASVDASYRALLLVALLSMTGAAAGSLLAGLHPDRRGALALVPLAATGLALALAWVSQVSTVPLALCLFVGLLGGLMNIPMLVVYRLAVPDDARGNAMAILNTAGYVSITSMSLAMAGLSAARVLSGGGQSAVVAVLAALGAAVAWRLLHGEVRQQWRALAGRGNN